MKTAPDWLTADVLARAWRVAYDFHLGALCEEAAGADLLLLAGRRRCAAEMVDHALRDSMGFDKPALGVAPRARSPEKALAES
jgi:hypothetical protein